MVIHTVEQVHELYNAISSNTAITVDSLKDRISKLDALSFFAAMKYEKIGNDPIKGHPLNLIEQLNQTYSSLVVLAGVKDLLQTYPDKSFELHLGAISGHDIQSTDGEVIAECFAVTSISSNDKLNKDCKKLMDANAIHKHIYFYSHEDSEKKLQNRYRKYPEICFKKVYPINDI